MHSDRSGFWIRLEKVPLLAPSLAVLSGTLAADAARAWLLWPLLLVTTLILAAACAAYYRGRLRACWVLLITGFFATGWLWNQAAYLARREEQSRLAPLCATGASPEWIGFLYRDPQTSPDKTVLFLQLESATYQQQTVSLSARARVTVFASEEGPIRFAFGEPVYGHRLRFRVPLYPPHNYRNPGSFDYADYLGRNGILLIGTLKSPLQATRVATSGGNRLLMAAYSVRRSFRTYLTRQFSDMQGGAVFSAILEALLFGEQSQLGRPIEQLFQETGTYHIFVVSGFNTTVIALALFWLLRKIRMPMMAIVPIIGMVLTAYALMTELGSPVVRASILAFIVLVAEAVYRRGNLLNSLSLAALVSLFLWPELAWDAGFQLTYLACLAIVLIGLPVMRHAIEPFRLALTTLFSENALLLQRDIFSRAARRFRFELELAAERVMGQIPVRRDTLRNAASRLARGAAVVGHYAVSLLVISLAVHGVMAPMMAWLFNRANVAAFMANLLVVPLMTVLLLATLFVGGPLWALGWTWPPWVLTSGWLLEHLLGWLRQMAQTGAWHWRVITPPLPWVFVYFFVVAIAVLPVKKLFRGVAAALALLFLTTFWWSPFAMLRTSPGQLEAYFLDVGQGDAIFLISPEGRTLLVDAGGIVGPTYADNPSPSESIQASRFDIGEDVVSRFLWTLRVRELDVMVLTHPHMDHAGGLAAVISNFPVRMLHGPWPIEKLQGLLPQLTELAGRRGLSWQVLSRGDSFSFGGSRVEVLNPPESLLGAFAHINNRSVVLRIQLADHAILLPGDVEKLAQLDLVHDCSALRADVLKVPHHGSVTSISDAFLECVQPRWAIISAGWNNRFMHPSPEVLARLRHRAIETLEISREGAIHAALSQDRVQLGPALPR